MIHLTIRADGGPDIGYGHLIRTGALAETFLEHGYAVTCATTTPEVAGSVYPDPVDVLALDPATEREVFPAWVRDEQPDIVLTDSYGVDTTYQRSLDSISSCLVVVLDDARHTICADILVNGNVYAPELEYEHEGGKPRWCLGPDYLLLKREVRARIPESPPWRTPPKRALVTMGGSDIQGTTPKVLPAFTGTDLIVDVIVGPGFDKENEREIERAATEVEADIRLLHNPPDLAERMFEADFAVSATGTTSYELLALGTPTIGIPQVQNQVPIAKRLSERNAMVHVPPARIGELGTEIETLLNDTERRRSLREVGRELVDGKGTERIFQIMVEKAT